MTVAAKLLVRADADDRIGTGHVMRCLALAQAWQAAGGQVVFLSRCPVPKLRERIRASSAELILLDHPHPHPADLSAVLAWLDQAGSHTAPAAPSWVVLDGYHFDAEYQRAVRAAAARLLVIDDAAQLPHYHAELLLNQNLGAEQLDYACDDDTTCLLGCRYAMLRPEFHVRTSLRRETPPIARKLLVTLGGADPKNATCTVLRALARLDVPAWEAKVVVGSANLHAARLREQLRHIPAGAELLTEVTDMRELMAWADLAVSAAGTTCWESAVMGLPAAVLVVAENQRLLAERLSEAGVATYLGRSEDLTPEQLADALSALCHDRGRRRRQSEAGRTLVDGCGVERVVAVMHALGGKLPAEQVTLRRAVAEDLLMVWRLANHPTVRRNSLSTASIPLEEHRAWFRHKLSDPAARMWVLDFQGLVVAVIRYDRTEPGVAEVSIQVAAGLRRRGLALRLLDSTRPAACRELQIRRVRAVVRGENLPSMRAFAKAGFTQVGCRPIGNQRCHVLERRT